MRKLSQMIISDSSNSGEAHSNLEKDSKDENHVFDPNQPAKKMLQSQDTVDKRILNIFRLHRAKEILQKMPLERQMTISAHEMIIPTVSL